MTDITRQIKQKAEHFLHILLNDFPRRHLLAASVVAACLVGLIIYPATDAEAKKQLAVKITLPVDLPTQELASEELDPPLRWIEQTVGAGDSLSTIFSRAKLTAADVYKISSSKDGKLLRNLFPGESFRFGLNAANELEQLHYIQSVLLSRIYSRDSDSYSSKLVELIPDTLLTYREGTIDDSLYLSAQQANLPDKLIMELANIFAWDIDFVFDIREGDSFSILYEEKYLNGEKLGVGNIAAASFTNRGKIYQAVRYTDSTGNSSYYTPDGLSMRKAFLRAPLDFMYVSSSFKPKRFHPILKRWKAHRGIDYRASTGTPIKAAGDGKIIESSHNKYNGKYVFIQHGNNIVTKYLHMSKRAISRGKRVKQGDIIGYVGATGLAEAPHLHYEFLVNGVHRNPRTVKLPQADPISKSKLAAFKLATAPVLTQLAQNQAPAEFALNGARAANQAGSTSAN